MDTIERAAIQQDRESSGEIPDLEKEAGTEIDETGNCYMT